MHLYLTCPFVLCLRQYYQALTKQTGSCIAYLLYCVCWQLVMCMVLKVKGLRGQLQTVMADSVVIVMFAVAM